MKASSSSSREPLSMETAGSKSASAGFYVKRGVALCLLGVVVALIALTAVIVYFAVPQNLQPPDGSSSGRSSTETSLLPVKNYEDHRLPGHLRPSTYHVRIIPFVQPGNFTTRGRVQVHLHCVSPGKNVTLHALELEIDNTTLDVSDGNGKPVAVSKVSRDEERQFFVIHLIEPLKVGTNYTVSMDFTGRINDGLAGFYRSKYVEDNQTRWLAATQFQATDARRAFPCLDEPAFKAKFKMTFARPRNLSVIANMPLEKTQPMPEMEGWVWETFEESVPMSTYLVGFVVSPFAYVESQYRVEPRFRVYSRPDSLAQTQYALDLGPRILEYFEQYFGLPFPLPKLDMVALPDFSAGAMENWGIITYRETAMLYDGSLSSAWDKLFVATVVSHELAHQWFGNLVTPKWWDDLWLNEGFASYMEYVGVDRVEPRWKILDLQVAFDIHQSFETDAYEHSHRISNPVNHPNEISQSFSTVTYSKGASIIRMMDYFLTHGTFRRGLTNYLESLKYDVAKQDNLWASLTKQGHDEGTLPKDMTVKAIMDTWTLQKGFPVLTVNRTKDGRGATVSQTRFLLGKLGADAEEGAFGYKWYVPLSYTTKSRADFTDTQPKAWLTAKGESITISDLPEREWVIFNVHQTGYYRVNYDLDNWQKLTKQLLEDHLKINTVNRAQILDDAFALARAGLLSYDIPFDLTKYLAKEKEYLPWSAAFRNLGYIKNMLTTTSLYGKFREYLLGLLAPHLSSLRLEGIDDVEESYERIADVFLSTNLMSWSCQLDHSSCVSNATFQFQQWMDRYDSTQPDKPLLSPNTKSIVYCYGVQEGKEKEWNFALKHMDKTNVASEKSKIMSSLGCTNEVWILSKYLGMMLDEKSGIRKQDISKVFDSVASNDVGIYLAFDYIQDNFDKIRDYLGAGGLFSLSRFVSPFGRKFNTQFYLKLLKDFYKNHEGRLGDAERATKQAIEKVESNIAWMESNYERISRWLDGQ